MIELTKLNKKGVKFHWPDSAQRAFDTAKNRLSSEKCISFADFKQPFTLVTDASEVALGAVLLQKIDNKVKIIACISKTLNETERRWSATERECYAIVYGIEKLQYFLKGPIPFTLLTDHKSLTFIDKNVFQNSKISRWQERLSEYRFICQYIEGASNNFADMLSRPFLPINKPNQTQPAKILGEFFQVPESNVKFYIPSWTLGTIELPKHITLEKTEQITSKSFLAVINDTILEKSPFSELSDISLKQREDKNLKKIIDLLENKVPFEKWKLDLNDENEKYFSKMKSFLKIHETTRNLLLNINGNDKIILPRSLVPYYLKICHDDSGHYGVDRVVHLLNDCTWPGKKADIVNYVSSCLTCLKRKGAYMQKTNIPMKNLDHGSKPFEHITVDFVHMKESRTGKKYILTIMDNLSRLLYVYPCYRDRAIDAVTGLKNFILEYGIPKKIGSDRGVHFINELFTNFCDQFNISHNIHAAYRPQSSGQLERVHRTLKNTLWVLVNDKNSDWEDMLPYARRAHNINHNNAINCSPYFCIFGKKPEVTGLFNDIYCNSPEENGHKTASVLKKAYCAIKLCQAEADANDRNKNCPNFKITEIFAGDQVLIKRDQSVASKTTNLSWIGPYLVINANNAIVQIQKDNVVDFIHRTQVVKIISRKTDLNSILNLPTSQKLSVAESGGVNAVNEESTTTPKENPATDNIRPIRTRQKPDRLEIKPKEKSYV